jgi:hypothetical protein
MLLYLSVRPPFPMEVLRSHWMEFYEIWYLSIFGKSVEKISALLKFAKFKRSSR